MIDLIAMDDVGIEYQTVLGCPPVEFVHLAADLGCRAISMKASTGPYNPYNPYGYDDFSFLGDAAARRRMAAPSGVDWSAWAAVEANRLHDRERRCPGVD